MDWDVRPVLAEHLLTEGFPLHELHGLVAAHEAFSGIGEAADT
jgi:hypothetical protein